jgi:D-alanyl-D-alanine dipeptidase
VSQLLRVPIRENGEPLVDFLKLDAELRLDRPRFDYRRETLLRASAADRLVRANRALLKRGFRLQVIEGWRPPFIQRRMYAAIWKQFSERHPDWSETKLKRIVNQFSAPMDRRVPPPHTTGGAMDLALYHLDGTPAEMQAPYGHQDHEGFAFDAPRLGEEARRHRDTMAEALVAEGLTNYPIEFWHWSFGDQGWAYRGGHECALYAAVEPPDWTPSPDDDREEPLVFVDDHPAA